MATGWCQPLGALEPSLNTKGNNDPHLGAAERTLLLSPHRRWWCAGRSEGLSLARARTPVKVCAAVPREARPVGWQWPGWGVLADRFLAHDTGKVPAGSLSLSCSCIPQTSYQQRPFTQNMPEFSYLKPKWYNDPKHYARVCKAQIPTCTCN